MAHKWIRKELLPEGREESDLLDLLNEYKIINCKITLSKGSTVGDGYVGQIIAINVEGQISGTNKQKVLNLILKYSPRSGIFTETVSMASLFHREIYMYSTIVPKIHALEDSVCGEKLFLPIAKLYKSSTEPNDEYLLMENMKIDHNFQLADRQKTLDVDHVELVLKQLGYYHGLSYVWKNKDPNSFDNYTECMKDNIFMAVMDGKGEFLNHLNTMIEKGIRLLDPIAEKSVYEKMLSLRQKGASYYLGPFCDSSFYDSKYTVILHGDCWSNNIFFKYNEQNKPIETCFVDWQLSRLASPAVELGYFIYNCTGTELRDNEFDRLIDVYYGALNQMLTKFHLNIDEILPFTILQDHITKYFSFGVCMACETIPLFVRDVDEVIEFSTMTSTDEFSRFESESKNNHLYVERMRGIFLHAASRNFI